MTLGGHLARVERYGFLRSMFPFEYHGHSVVIVHNDAHRANNDRIYVRFALACTKCTYMSAVRGRFSRDAEHAQYRIAVAKVATLSRFKYNDCR